MEQLVILIIIGVISLINWLLQKSAEHKSKRPTKSREASGPLAHALDREEDFSPEPVVAWEEEPPVAKPKAESQAELRRFFEAMGIPMEEEVAPEPVVRPSFVEPPPLPKPPQTVVAAPPMRTFVAPARRERVSERYMELAKGFARAEEDEEATPSGDFQGFLSHPSGLRQAMILREILGPPKALADMGATGENF